MNVEVRNESLENMIQRKKTQCTCFIILTFERKTFYTVEDVAYNVSVTQHHTFWCTGGTACINNGCAGFGIDGLPQLRNFWRRRMIKQRCPISTSRKFIEAIYFAK